MTHISVSSSRMWEYVRSTINDHDDHGPEDSDLDNIMMVKELKEDEWTQLEKKWETW